MNKRSFRLIFDRERGMLVAAGEHLASRGKSSQGTTRGVRRSARAGAYGAAVLLAAGMQLAGPPAQAARSLSSEAAAASTRPALQRSANFGPRFTGNGFKLPQPTAINDPAHPFMQLGTVKLMNEKGELQDAGLPISNAVLKLLIDQGAQNKVILNWSSYGVAGDRGVYYIQPDGGSVLNYIRGNDPALVMGRIASSKVQLDASGKPVKDADGQLVLVNNPTGEVILQSGNGVIFGPTARVDTGRFVATALGISQEAYQKGYRTYRDGTPVFDVNLSGGNLNAGVVVERGAELVAAAGGDVLIIAPRIVNEGRIETPDGQTVLAAGRQVYLVSSSDSAQRGLVVSVNAPASDGAGLYTIEQGAAQEYKTVDGKTVADSTPDGVAGLVKKVNAIVAERGSINLVGLAIKQNGLLQATSAVKGKNGVIQLVAEQSAAYERTHPDSTAGSQTGTRLLGQVTFGEGSRTEVLPSTSSDTQLQAENSTYAANISKILVEGSRIDVQSGATLKVPSGVISMFAADNAYNQSPQNGGVVGDSSRIVVESGATLDVSGMKDVVLPMSRNQLGGRLFSIELADAPVQRDGVLYRQAISFDARTGTPVADVSGLYNNVERTAAELATVGGKISLSSGGGLVLDQGATVDISGGSVRYADGTLTTSLVRYGNMWIPISEASPGLRYTELYTPSRGTAVAGYVEGRNAGSATFDAHRMYFDATLKASVTRGAYQSGRGSAALPVAGSVTFGGKLYQNAIQLQKDAAAAPAGLLADPLNASVNLIDTTLALSTDGLSESGLAKLALYTDKNIDLAAGAKLTLDAGGSLTAHSYDGAVTLSGSIEAHGGSISAYGKTKLALGSGASLDVSGTWSDDKANPGNAAAGVVVDVNGGDITLSTLGDLTAEAGSVLDVSAGALRSGSGVDTKGTAGSLVAHLIWEITRADPSGKESPVALPEDIGDFRWDGAWRGYDFSKGGTLKISGLDGLRLGTSSLFSPGFFNDHGFGTFALSTKGNVLVDSSFDATLSLQNYQTVRSRSTTQRFAEIKTLSDARQRGAVSLTLTGNRSDTRDVAGSSLVVEDGARIETEAGGKLALSSQRNMTIAGSLIAPGGSISLTNGGTSRGTARPTDTSVDDNVGFLRDQALWLTPSAHLSVAGTAETATDGLGRRIGDVFAAGSISLTANRGYVIAESGSVLDLDGYADTLYSARTVRNELVSRSAGSLSLSTPEGFVLESTLLARAPNAAADGGSISVAVTFAGQQDFYMPSSSGVSPYPTDPREIRLVDAASDRSRLVDGLSTTGTGRNVYAALGNGWGELSAAGIKQAGFANVSLQADEKITLNLHGAAGLDISGRLTLSTPVLAAAAGSTNHLGASYVAMGNQRTRVNGNQKTDTAYIPPQASVGAAGASLSVDAGLIEIYGLSALQGIGTANLNATRAADGSATRTNGEIRLIEVKSKDALVGTLGGLRFAGDLNLTAGQVYATTLTNFTLDGCNGCSNISSQVGNTSHLTFNAPAGGSSSLAPLSALGSLKAVADTIDQNGVIRQPFGEIRLQADALNIKAGSITSVSGDGLTIPVGATIGNGQKWVYYANSDDLTGLRSESLDALPLAKGVTLNGGTLSVASTAQLDAAAGGDLQAWEFIAGVGGSADYLSRPGLYAVIPSYGYDYAPYDADVVARGGALQAGRQIEITMAGSALAPGRYTLLPARYALLPGAVLVSLAADQGRNALKTAQQNDDGSTIVTGSFTASGSNARSDAGTRLLVEPASTFLAKSQQQLSSISDLLAGQAAALGKSRPNLPRDGGRISLVSSNPFAFSDLAQIKLAGQKDALAGQLDLSVVHGKFAIVDDTASDAAQQKASDGWTVLSADKLSSLDAGSLLIGGVRSGTDTLGLDVQASVVELLKTGASTQETALQAGEVILAAKDDVRLGDGTRLEASGSADPGSRTLELDGDSALAMVSNSTSTVVARTNATNRSGNLAVADGAVLGGPAAYLNASGNFGLSAKARMSVQTLGLAANQVSIGSAPANTGGVVLQGDLLASIQRSAKALQLTGLRGITFYGTQSLAVDALTLDAPTIVGKGQAGDVVTLQARQLTLRNTTDKGQLSGTDGQPVTSQTMTAAMQGASRLVVETRPDTVDTHIGGLDIGPGRLALGFESAQLSTTGDVTFRGTGMLVAQGDVTMRAARVTSATAANNGIDAGRGNLRFERHAEGHTLGERVGQGAQIAFKARQIQQAGRIEVLAGQLDFQAQGAAGQDAIEFSAGSLTKVSGFSAEASKTYSVQADAGSIRATAAAGNVAVDGSLDVAGVGDANAGTIALTASAGLLDVGSDAQLLARTPGTSQPAAALGGSILIDAGRLAYDGQASDSLDPLASKLATAGFSREVNVRVRNGDLRFGASPGSAGSAKLQARRTILAADAGQLTLGGSIASSAPGGGVVQLHAGQGVTLLSTAAIDARSTRAGANGGDVLLSAANGRIVLAGGAAIDASGDDALDGRIVLRAPRIDNGDGSYAVDIAAFDSSALKAAEIAVAGIQRYEYGGALEISDGTSADNGSGTSILGRADLTAGNQAFMNSAGAILAAVGAAGDSRVHVRPDVEIVALGDITISGDWDLSASDHYDGTRTEAESGFLTVRAGGNLRLDASLSDGFDGAGRKDNQSGEFEPTAITQANGWSYRLVAGADTGSADAMRTNTSLTGNLEIASDKIVRTTSGSIELAAGRNITLEKDGDQATQAVVYVTGRTSNAIVDSGYYDASGLADLRYAWTPQFTAHGGRVELAAGNDVIGQAATQLFGAWFYHTGQTASTGLADATVAWWSAFDSFRMGVGSFGGSDVRVVAGRDIKDLGIVAPTSALASGKTPETSSMLIENGGDLYAKAGRDILGGSYFLGRGDGWLIAGREVGMGSATRTDAGEAISSLGALVGVMDGRINVLANGPITLNTVFNPTMLPSAEARVSAFDDAGLYFTYSDQSAVTLRSTTGDITWQDLGAADTRLSLQRLARSGGEEAATGSSAANSLIMDTLMRWTTPNLAIEAISGDIDFRSSTVLMPSATGQLELFAGGDVTLSARIVMPDDDPSLWLSPTRPADYDAANPTQTSSSLYTFLLLHKATGDLPSVTGESDPNLLSGPLPRRFQGIHQGDLTPARIHAGGSIDFGDQLVQIPKAAEITAGLDIVNLSKYIGEHLSSSDITVISAGRNFLAHPNAATFGKAGTIYLLGPGQLQVTAGRQVDLGVAHGFELSGNRYNPDLPATSASIRLQAGTDVALDVDAFVAGYLSLGSGNDAAVQARRDALVKAVREALGLAPLADDQLAGAYDTALAQFRTLSSARQAAFAQEQFTLAFAARYLVPGQAYANNWATAALDSGIAKLDVDAFVTGYLTPGTGDGTTVQARRNAMVKAVREALGLPPLADIALPAAFPEALAQFRTLSATEQLAFAKSQLAVGSSAAGQPNADTWASAALAAGGGAYLSDPARFDDPAFAKVFDKVRDKVTFAELDRVGYAASNTSDAAVRTALYAQGFQALDLAGHGETFSSVGNINLTTSRVTTYGGDITMLAQGGRIDVGVPAITENSGKAEYGVIAYGGGNINAMTYSDFQVASQKVFVAGSNLNDIVVWSSHGNIDNGRGSNTVVTIPAMVAVFNPIDGTYSFQLPPLTTGSGIGVLAADEDACKALGTCNIGLYAPNGEVLALDTLIRAPGRISLAAQVVRGADNIVGGSVSGAPAVAVAPPPMPTPNQPDQGKNLQESANNNKPANQARNAVLTVELIGMGLEPTGAGPADAGDCRSGESEDDCRKRRQGRPGT